MVTYKYSGISPDGQKVSGVVEAFNEMDAVNRIKQSCKVVLKVSEVKEEKPGLLNMEIGGEKLNNKAFTVMCSQFAIILKAGIPISRTVHLIAEKTTDKPLKRMLKKVAEDVESGRSLAAAFEERGSKLLPQIFIETIRAGEESGTLERSFETMYKHYDKQTKMRGKVKSALAYPAFVLVIAIIVVIVLMVKVVPTFTSIFDSYGAELPGITKALIAISDFFRNYILIILAVVAVAIIALKIYGNTENGRLKLAQIALKMPVFGNINSLNAASQFANAMTTLLGSGLPMTKSINITSKVIDNYHISKEVGKLSGKIEEGKTLGASVREAGCLPDILVDMVGVGEETGELEETLGTVAGYYDAELETAVAKAIAKLEPGILVGLALIAGFIVIAVYVAMFEMYNAM
ncbi:MAG: type II secretion system F family protein [Clostridia bacterium]|nr:type II secretion system F family protein [Clostridia bacterium]